MKQIDIHPNHITVIRIFEKLLLQNPKNIHIMNEAFKAYFQIYGSGYAFNFLNQHIKQHDLDNYVVSVTKNFVQIIEIIETQHSIIIPKDKCVYSKLKQLISNHPILAFEYQKWTKKISNQQASRLESINLLVSETKNIKHIEIDNKSLCNMLPKSILRGHLVAMHDHTSYLERRINLEKLKSYLKYTYNYNIFDIDNDKLKDKKFAQKLNIPVPKLYQENVKFSNIQFRNNSIIKPADPLSHSSKYVFYYFNKNDIRLVSQNKKTFESIEALLTYINRITHTNLVEDSWVVEELILGENNLPSEDYKLYCFYGNIGLLLQSNRLVNEKSYFDMNGKLLSEASSTGVFTNFSISNDCLQYAKLISEHIPYPFARIDFYKNTQNDFFLGEITPNPGLYYIQEPEIINFSSVDESLGKLLLDAEARLYKDLLSGKEFSTFKSVYNIEVNQEVTDEH